MNEAQSRFDILIRNGLVFDGLGNSPVLSDIGIRSGKIVAIGKGLSGSANETRDAQNKWVTPGFIDIHTHYDIEVEISPALHESLQHGVTSAVMGNCSLSLTFGDAETLANMFLRVETLPRVLLEKWLEKSLSWSSPEEYIEHLGTLALGPNISPMLGHSALRAYVMGLERSLSEYANPSEISTMKKLAEQALDAGCIGISIDMVPWHMMSGEFRGITIPSQHANYREYAMLADVCRERDAIFQVTPNPKNWWTLLDICRLSVGITRPPLRVTVLAALDSVVHRSLWRFYPAFLFLMNVILRSNLRLQTLTEPFTVFSDGPITPLFEEFPSGVELNNHSEREAREKLWQNPIFRKQFRDEWVKGDGNTFHRDLNLMHIVSCPEQDLVGKSIAQAAKDLGFEPLDFFIQLLEKYDTNLRWVSTGANDRAVPRQRLMAHPHILPGFTDAGAHVQNLGYYDGALSLLKQAITTGFITPEKAVSRVTSEPANWFRLDRGVLKVGAVADLLILNPEKLVAPISEQESVADPLLDGARRMVKRNSDEILEAVFVKGECVYSAGIPSEKLSKQAIGEVLCSQKQLESEVVKKVGKRNRISAEIQDHPFSDYWDIFVLKHREPWNIAAHVAGVLVYYGVVLLALVFQNFWLLFLLPLSQLIGLAGHALFEKTHIDTHDAIFSRRAIRCLHKLFFLVLQRRYSAEINRVEEILDEYHRSKTIRAEKHRKVA